MFLAPSGFESDRIRIRFSDFGWLDFGFNTDGVCTPTYRRLSSLPGKGGQGWFRAGQRPAVRDARARITERH